MPALHRTSAYRPAKSNRARTFGHYREQRCGPGRDWSEFRLLAARNLQVEKIAAFEPEYHQQQHARCADQRRVNGRLTRDLTAKTAIFSVPGHAIKGAHGDQKTAPSQTDSATRKCSPA